ncbi:DoxX family protein [Mycobacterium deserti]|uniref:DoxX family protein n=1 Tax=Mycobacterium deserti TaxID=2978347 RepID=A0ABT2MA62_9MYCO|nr:DoxX family protein [Mycobacterium deserti]MCT7659164.1 DoxX family protein [Mycobacterium deserti]
MTSLPDPQWPVIVLAVIQFGDALMCLKPLRFIEECFTAVNWPRRFWWMMAPIKFAAALGLIAGLWIPYLGALTCAALVAYFVCAIAAHILARDFGRNLFLNATGMLVICIAVGLYCFLI